MRTRTTFPPKKPPAKAQALAEQVERDRGHVLSIFQDPIGDHWHLFCLLPIGKVEATP